MNAARGIGSWRRAATAAAMILASALVLVALACPAGRAEASEVSQGAAIQAATVSSGESAAAAPASEIAMASTSAARTAGSYRYKVNSDGSATITKYIGSKNIKKLVIPKKIRGHRVTVIGKKSFMNLAKLKKVVIPSGVKRVKSYAFSGDYTVTSLKLPSTLKRVDEWAFYGLQLKNVKLPSKLTKIGGGAFAYASCVTLPKTAKKFDWMWFASGDGTCTLSSIKVAKGNKNFLFEDGVLYNKDKTRIVYYLVSNNRSAFKVPNSVKVIEKSAFSWSFGLQSVTLGKHVTEIGDNAFAGSPVGETFTLPASVKKLGSSCFGANTKTLIVKSKKLTAANVKDCVKGSSITSVLVNVGTWEQNRKYAEKYSDIFDYYDYYGNRKYVYVSAY